jgi:hypothetical protein
MNTFVIGSAHGESIFMISIEHRIEIVNRNYNYRLLVACDTQIGDERECAGAIALL